MNNVTAANTANPAAATPAPRSPVLGESLFALVVVVAVVVFAVVVVVTAVVVVVESAVVVVVSVAVVVVVVVVYSGFLRNCCYAYGWNDIFLVRCCADNSLACIFKLYCNLTLGICYELCRLAVDSYYCALNRKCNGIVVCVKSCL